MTQVDDNIYVGDLDDYRQLSDDNSFVFVQACKNPCHQKAVGYEGELPKDNPEYISALRSNGIAINMIDSISPLHFSYQQFDDALAFINSNTEKKILIHCNQGVSRSPSIALLHLAKKGKIKNNSYQSAKSDFESIYPNYRPNDGIKGFLTMHWPRFIYAQ